MTVSSVMDIFCFVSEADVPCQLAPGSLAWSGRVCCSLMAIADAHKLAKGTLLLCDLQG